jgi:hypothetical protein
MLEGAIPRAAVNTCAATADPAERFAGLLRGDFKATVLPYITIAERPKEQPCTRLVCARATECEYVLRLRIP